MQSVVAGAAARGKDHSESSVIEIPCDIPLREFPFPFSFFIGIEPRSWLIQVSLVSQVRKGGLPR